MLSLRLVAILILIPCAVILYYLTNYVFLHGSESKSESELLMIINNLKNQDIEFSYNITIELINKTHVHILSGILTYGVVDDKARYLTISYPRDNMFFMLLIEKKSVTDRLCIFANMKNLIKLNLCNSSSIVNRIDDFVDKLVKYVLKHAEKGENRCYEFSGRFNVKKLLEDFKELIINGHDVDVREAFKDGSLTNIKLCTERVINNDIISKIYLSIIDDNLVIKCEMTLLNIAKSNREILKKVENIVDENLTPLLLLLP